jgi:hypothetical protein
MRDIQYKGGNNILLTERIVKSCIKACDKGCDGEQLVAISLPAGAVLLELFTIGHDLEADVVAPLTIGISENNTLMHEEALTVPNGMSAVVELSNLTVGAESVVVTITTEVYPTTGGFCVFIKYLDVNATVGVVNAVIPDLCSDECGCA